MSWVPGETRYLANVELPTADQWGSNTEIKA